MNTYLLTADRMVLLAIIEQQEQMIAQLQAELASVRAELAQRDAPQSESESATAWPRLASPRLSSAQGPHGSSART